MKGIFKHLSFVAAYVSASQALPVACLDDAQCYVDHYCDLAEHFCRECLKCDQLKREPSIVNTTCITSATDCGSCSSGLVEEIGSIGEKRCVVADSGEGEMFVPSYQLVAAIIALQLLAVFLCVVVVYVLRNFRTYKLFASMRANVRTVDANSDVVASAPLPPPPYEDATTILPLEESTLPLIKPVLPLHPADIHDSAAYQAACVYNPPTYERSMNLSSLSRDAEMSATTFEENVMNSLNSIGINNNAVVTESDILENDPSIEPSLSEKTRRFRQNSNTGSDYSGESFSGGQYLPTSPFIINIIKNITAVQQQNDVTI